MGCICSSNGHSSLEETSALNESCSRSEAVHARISADGRPLYVIFDKYPDGRFSLSCTNTVDFWGIIDQPSSYSKEIGDELLVNEVWATLRRGGDSVEASVRDRTNAKLTFVLPSGKVVFRLPKYEGAPARDAVQDFVADLFAGFLVHRDTCSRAMDEVDQTPARSVEDLHNSIAVAWEADDLKSPANGSEHRMTPVTPIANPIGYTAGRGRRVESLPAMDNEKAVLWNDVEKKVQSPSPRTIGSRADRPPAHARSVRSDSGGLRKRRTLSASTYSLQNPYNMTNERMVHILRDIRCKFQDGALGVDDIAQLGAVIGALDAGNVYGKMIKSSLPDDKELDAETRRFLDVELFNKSCDEHASDQFMTGMYTLIFTNKLKRRLSIRRQSSAERSPDLERMLIGLSQWQFEPVEFASVDDSEHPLVIATMAAMQSLHLFKEVRLSEGAVSRLENLLRDLERGYKSNPYHNSVHAVDVMQTFFSIICKGDLRLHYEPFELLAAILACAAHDVGHPGVNNNYLIRTRAEHAITYNDRAVLENFHASRLCLLLSQPENNFLSEFPLELQRDFREVAIRMILATDISQHFSIVSAFQAAFAEREFDRNSKEDRLMELEMFIKAADISNPGKRLPTYVEWAGRVMEEFFNQGDLERSKKLEVSAFMDRTRASPYKCQLGFIDYIARPMFEALAGHYDIFVWVLDQLNFNRDFLLNEKEKGTPFGSWDPDVIAEMQFQAESLRPTFLKLYGTG